MGAGICEYRRYNPRRSPSENINLPQALLSRFDILFLLMYVIAKVAICHLLLPLLLAHCMSLADGESAQGQGQRRFRL